MTKQLQFQNGSTSVTLIFENDTLVQAQESNGIREDMYSDKTGISYKKYSIKDDKCLFPLKSEGNYSDANYGYSRLFKISEENLNVIDQYFTYEHFKDAIEGFHSFPAITLFRKWTHRVEDILIKEENS